MFHNIAFKSNYLKLWYRKFSLAAALADVLILVIGIIIARFFYGYIFTDFSIWKFTGLAVSIQIVHDFLFYLLFKNTPVGYSYILDFFKKYAREIGWHAIVGDSVMMIAACLFHACKLRHIRQTVMLGKALGHWRVRCQIVLREQQVFPLLHRSSVSYRHKKIDL